MENEKFNQQKNEIYRLTWLDWLRWGFDLVVFFAERWDSIPKPTDRQKRNNQDSEPPEIPLDRPEIRQSDIGSGVA